MTEGFKPGARGEHLFSPEYWDGHSLKDSCEWLDKQYRTDGVLKVVRDANAEINTTIEAWKAISEFLTFSGRSPVRTFGRGEVFDGRAHPLGTVVRLSEESLYEDDKGRPRLFKRKNYWGILAEGIEGLTLVQFTDYALESGMRTWGIHKAPTREIGVTHHTKSRFPKRFPWSKNPTHQSIDRTNFLQIMGVGKAIRKPIFEVSVGIQRQLSPA